MQNRDIAIIGIAGKYPKSNSPEELWHHILSHRDLSLRYLSASEKRSHWEVSRQISDILMSHLALPQ